MQIDAYSATESAHASAGDSEIHMGAWKGILGDAATLATPAAHGVEIPAPDVAAFMIAWPQRNFDIWLAGFGYSTGVQFMSDNAWRGIVRPPWLSHRRSRLCLAVIRVQHYAQNPPSYHSQEAVSISARALISPRGYSYFATGIS
jgi:hypothetical protein